MNDSSKTPVVHRSVNNSASKPCFLLETFLQHYMPKKTGIVPVTRRSKRAG